MHVTGRLRSTALRQIQVRVPAAIRFALSGRMPEREPSTKVLFRVRNEDGSADVETLWATSLGADNYKLDNSPFYAYGVSWEDVVHAPFDPEEQFPAFQ